MKDKEKAIDIAIDELRKELIKCKKWQWLRKRHLSEAICMLLMTKHILIKQRLEEQEKKITFVNKRLDLM